ncbi:MAG: ATP-dependent RNA helicase HrpA [Nocardioides sp.]|uniref:ATP-dependent RNA helicase HrpA n=1 Tax=Nocardioides sp. TaxID=35761 RepID=UPI0039E463FF
MSELAITYPDLPVSAVREEIAEAIRAHQVVIVAGETGSGKTTQLPKVCLELGRGGGPGVDGGGTIIGHTQPRRIAARSVAERIADELSSDGLGDGVGSLVGYQVRFTDRTSKASRVKLMTDGILLAELQRDRDLRRYDTIIIDEAHERSLNIDFLLGYLKQLLPRRPDLKLIVTSATIDTERFAEHFCGPDGTPAPVIEVSGRTFPVEIRYRPLMELPEAGPSLDTDGDVVVKDQTEAIVDAVKELSAEGPGDVLVFLPGEREIRDTADALSGMPLDVVPLYSRLSAADQHKVFSPHTGRRVVLATNVAETSLTVPGIRYVVDTGVARISRYSARTKVQRLPVEPISQASANQRSGRCGRVADGIAIRLYSEEEYDARPEFTDPEILRTNLASVILQMASLRLGAIEDFPFVEPPDRRNIASGVQLLEELGAFEHAASPLSSRRKAPLGGGEAPLGGLTTVGQRLARLPIDPRLGRMVLEADRLGCLREVIVVAAALSLQDPRERPGPDDPAGQARADQAHARFKHPHSDFLSLLNLWRYLKEQQRELSSSAFRRMCRTEHLHYLRVREWQEFESQLRQVCRELGITGEPADSPDEDGIHQALLSGLLSHIGALDVRDDKAERAKGRRPGPREYLGARGTRFAIFPGSGQARRNPPFVMAGELVETSRLWARQVASIKPEWAERLAPHLVKRTYGEPHWSRRRAAVMAHEKVTLYGVPLVADRLVPFGRVDPVVARELFIRHALVQREWKSDHGFLRRNARRLEEARELEHKARRRDIVVDEHVLFDFYDARVGEEVVSGAHFDSWWRRQRDKGALDIDPAALSRDVDVSEFPSEWHGGPAGDGGVTFNLSYRFEPGSAEDGMTIDIPVATLNRVDDGDFSWNVPGNREELVTTLIRGLPKQLRVQLVPAPDRAREFLAAVPPGGEPLLDALERWIRSVVGVVVPREAWAPLPEHLRPTYRVLDERGRTQARGKDLDALKAPLAGEFERAIGEVAADAGLTATGQTTWTFGEIAATVTERRAGHEVTVHRCLVDEGDAVGLAVVGTADEAEARHRLGVARLLLLGAPSPAKRIVDGLSLQDRLALTATPYPSAHDLVEDCRAAVARMSVDAHPLPRTPEAYAVTRAHFEADLDARVRAVLDDALRALAAHRDADKALTGRVDVYQLPAVTDMRAQLARLVAPGFIADAGSHLRRYPTYLLALRRRRERLDDAAGLRRDAELMAQLGDLQERYLHALAALPDGRPAGARLREVRWLIEEWRVGLWAQQLGTAVPVSDARIRRVLEGQVSGMS